MMMIRKVVFWSSVDSAMFMHAVVAAIRANGIPAEHRYGISSSAYRQAVTPLQRAMLRIRMYIEYPMRLAWAVAFTREPTVFVVTTNPFFAPLVAALVAARRHSVVHLVWDLFPDALMESGSRVKHPLVLKTMEWLVRGAIVQSDANVFLGQRLRAHAGSRFPQVHGNCIIPVGADASVFVDSPPRRVEPATPVDVLYCGNLGSMHDVDTLLGALRSAERGEGVPRGVRITFHASGPRFAAFRHEVGALGQRSGQAIELCSSLDNEAWTKRMRQAHVALVTMRPGSEKVVMPSKAYSALAAGQAILAVCPRDSDLAQMVIDDDCGWVVEPGHHDELLRVLREMATQRERLHVMRLNAFRSGQSKYSAAAVADLWIKLLGTLGPDQHA